jgi:DNA helicase II / ATP-dependent DNA helicase PcrA
MGDVAVPCGAPLIGKAGNCIQRTTHSSGRCRDHRSVTTTETGTPDQAAAALSDADPVDDVAVAPPSASAGPSKALEALDPTQAKIATHRGSHALVAAAAGSGKTRVLTARAGWLIEQGVDPEQIRVVTFTNAAAEELTDRLSGTVGPAADGTRTSTLHALGQQLIDEDPEGFGFDRRPVVVDRDTSERIMRNRASGCGDKATLPPGRIRGAVAQVRAGNTEGLSPAEIAMAECIAAGYADSLKAAGLVDLDDLVGLPAARAAADPDYAATLAGRYQHLLLDEYQDLDPTQAALISAMSADGTELFAVGDPRQAIYGFRGGDAELLDGLDSHRYDMATSYRSTSRITALADAIADPDGIHAPTVAMGGDGVTPELYDCFDQAEERTVAIDLVDDARHDGSAAILVRTRDDAAKVMADLEARGIPAQSYLGGSDAPTNGERAGLAAVRLSVSPDDDIAVATMLSEAPGVGDKTIEKLNAHAAETGQPLRTVLADPAAAGVKGAPAKKVLEASAVVDAAAAASSPADAAAALSPWNLKGADAFAAAAQTGATADTQQWLSDWAQRADPRVTLPAGTVAVATVHASKGLEFDHVVVTGVDADAYTDSAEDRRLAYVAASRAGRTLAMTRPERRFTYGRNVTADASPTIPAALVDRQVGTVRRRAVTDADLTGFQPVLDPIGTPVAIRDDGRTVLRVVSPADATVRMSPTAMDRLGRCPSAWHAIHVARHTEEPSATAESGKALHDVAQQLAELPAAQRTPAKADELLTGRLAAESASILDDDARERARRLAPVIAKHVASRNVIAAERHVEIGGPQARHGHIDLLVQDPDGVIAIEDLKTGKAPKGDSHDGIAQTIHYAAMIRAQGGESVGRVRLVFPDSGTDEPVILERDVTAADLDNADRLVAEAHRRAADVMSTGTATACPSGSCKNCPVAAGCPVRQT